MISEIWEIHLGGYGSGPSRRRNSGTVEGCRSLDVRYLHSRGSLQPGLVFSMWWTNTRTGQEMASVGIRTYEDSIVLSYRYRPRDTYESQGVEEQVHLTWTQCNYGGRRPWFVCPGQACGRRVALLYSAGQHYRCRHCYRLAYACQREGVADRALSRTQNIRIRLGGSGSLPEPFPRRPKEMRWRTYLRLYEKATRAERQYWQAMAEWLQRIGRR